MNTQTVDYDELLAEVRALRRYEVLAILEADAAGRDAFNTYMMAAMVVWFAEHGHADDYRLLVDQAAHHQVWGAK